jgi:hypothetical protein
MVRILLVHLFPVLVWVVVVLAAADFVSLQLWIDLILGEVFAAAVASDFEELWIVE